jgi:predicted small secreted protein
LENDMKRLICGMAAAMLLSMSLTACNTVSAATTAGAIAGAGASVTTAVAPPEVVAKVQSYAATACKFVPTAGTVASIAATFTNYGDQVALAKGIANAVCDSLHQAGYAALEPEKKPKRSHHKRLPSTGVATDGTPTVNGVPVRGSPVQ